MDLTNAKIFVIGYYPNYFKEAIEINKKIQIIVENRNLIFIDIKELSQNESLFYDIKKSNLNIEGHKKIFYKQKYSIDYYCYMLRNDGYVNWAGAWRYC